MSWCVEEVCTLVAVQDNKTTSLLRELSLSLPMPDESTHQSQSDALHTPVSVIGRRSCLRVIRQQSLDSSAPSAPLFKRNLLLWRCRPPEAQLRILKRDVSVARQNI